MCFGHLHVHSEYSPLDGMGKVKELLETAKSYEQNFIAITDHGSTSGLLEAQQIGEKVGIKVIHGTEFYYEKDDGENGHLLVLAKNNEGLRNILLLQEFGYVHNFSRKPRVTWEKLIQHKTGLIITSSCLASQYCQYILDGKVDKAKAWAKRAKDEFGSDFYIEIQPNKIPEQILVNETSIRIANELGVELVATNDVHYTFKADCFPHEVMLAMQVKRKMSDEKRFKFSTNDFWLKTEEEMYDFNSLPRDIVSIALRNTKAIADKCFSRFEKGNYLPNFHTIPDGKTERQLLIEKTLRGARELGLSTDKSFMEEVQNEINVIDRNGYSGYFLIVEDYVNSARRKGIIVGDGRGSGAGSKVAYLTGITKIPPHRYNLLFERFMADGRSPDFDVDFSDQDAVFEDLARKFGSENVARIIAFGRLTPRAVIRKVFNTFEHPMSLQNEITKLVPDLCPSLEQAYKNAPKLLDYKRKYKVEWDVIERLEGVMSHESQHAGGIIIYPGISEILPVKTNSDNRSKRIVGFDKEMLESLGHYKFDVLGLETLPIIKRTLDFIQSTTGKTIDLHNTNLDDERVYDMLCRGDVSGVFQINNQAAKVVEQQPRNFLDLIAINSLIRPGVGDWREYIARRRGKPWSVHPNRKSYMDETVGTLTYQEQFLLDCQVFAGWDIAYSDKYVRKAKNLSKNEELRNKFLSDSEARGFSREVTHPIWEEICDAVDGGYSFNKSHSTSYAKTSFDTAYLKCYYPIQFYASLMTGEKTDGDGQKAIAGYMSECKARGIQILPPDINRSEDYYYPTKDGIVFSISTIRGIGDEVVKWIMRNRPFNSFGDFMERRDTTVIKQNIIVNLIKAGCFDTLDANRGRLLWELDMSNRTKTQIKQEFVCPLYEYNDTIKAEWEKETTGSYLSTHPMQKYGFKSLYDFPDDSRAIIGGIVQDIREFKDKNKRDMAFVTIETLYGPIKLVFFASVWDKPHLKALAELDAKIAVEGKRSGDSLLVFDGEVIKR